MEDSQHRKICKYPRCFKLIEYGDEVEDDYSDDWERYGSSEDGEMNEDQEEREDAKNDLAGKVSTNLKVNEY